MLELVIEAGVATSVALPTVVALGLLVVAVVASLVPGLPGGLLAAVAIVGHWLVVGEPSIATTAVLAGIALLTSAFDLLAGMVAGERGGASRSATVVGTTVGVLGLFVLGFLGFLVGLLGGVFLVEFVRQRDKRRAGRAALYAGIGVLASNLLQALVLLVVTANWVWLVLG